MNKGNEILWPTSELSQHPKSSKPPEYLLRPLKSRGHDHDR